MNFLAHLFLSENRPKLTVGNFIGDFVKGRHAKDRFEAEIAKGIELHRNIDMFTDKHPTVSKSKKRLQPKYRHYSGVIVDVFYDHFLASNWNIYHDQPLADFADFSYSTLSSFDTILPEEVKGLLPYMINQNWLLNYAKTEGINRALTGMSKRTPYESKMNEAVTDLISSYDEFGEEFKSFFPELHGFTAQWIKEHV